MEEHTYTEFFAPFPICNHIEGFDPKYNHGYTQGVTSDGIPFEAELWSTDTECNITIIFPENFDMYEGIDPYADVLIDRNPDDPIPYQSQDELIENGILSIGMVKRERIDNINVIIAYVDYFEECGLYEFVSDIRNGYLMQVTDVNGNYLLQLNITTWSKEMDEIVEVYLDFKPFVEIADDKKGKILKMPRRK